MIFFEENIEEKKDLKILKTLLEEKNIDLTNEEGFEFDLDEFFEAELIDENEELINDEDWNTEDLSIIQEKSLSTSRRVVIKQKNKK